jgi:nicotinate-nucleotide adenylyltransferase
MRLGIFGGSFDPVHYGHLLLAECCREQARLDHVWFVPAHIPPHKQEHVLAPASCRVEMLRLAIGGHPALEACTLEIDRGGVSYTVDTLETLHAEDPSRKLFLLLGADSLADLPNWRQPERICQLAELLVVGRGETGEPDFSALASLVPPQRLAAIAAAVVEMPIIGISASDLRRRVAAGQSIRYRTPRAVEQYIASHGLYRAGGGRDSTGQVLAGPAP